VGNDAAGKPPIDRQRLTPKPSSHASRHYPERPVLGVGALIFRRNSILLVERGREPLKGLWSLPGGVLETGEMLAAGIRREVREETGLHVRPLFVHEIFERIMRDGKGAAEYHYVLVDYVCKVEGGELQPGDDVSRALWVPRLRLMDYEVTEGTLEVIERAFEDRSL
jgi:ADP-ribose pyrophosphatase YjhB (NUDIX family)